LKRLPYVFFDIGHTLITTTKTIPEIYAEAFNEYGADVTSEALMPVFRDVWQEMEQYVTPGEDRYRAFKGGEREWWAHFVRRVAEVGDIDVSPEPVFEKLYDIFRAPETWVLYEEVLGVLDTLRNEGWRCGVISNWDRRLTRLLDDCGLSPYFDPIVISAVEGIEKPAERIFEIAAERAGVAPTDCVHVGDSLHFDVEGAVAAGFRAVHLTREKGPSIVDFVRGGDDVEADSPGASHPPITLQDLRELPTLLESWS